MVIESTGLALSDLTFVPMAKHAKIMLGLMTFVPMVLSVLLLLAMIDGWFIPEAIHGGDQSEILVLLPLGFSLLLLTLTLVLGLGVTVYYLVHSINNPNIDSTQRLVWVLVILMSGLFGCALYWLFLIWREEPPEVSGRSDFQ